MGIDGSDRGGPTAATRPGVPGRQGRAGTWQRLGAPQVIGWRALAIYAVTIVAAPILADAAVAQGAPAQWAAVALVAFAVPAALFLVGRRLHGHAARRGLAPHFIVSLLLIAGALRGLAVGATEVGLGMTTDPEVVFRVLGGLTFAAGLLVAAGLVVVLHDEHRDLVHQLVADRERLAHLRGSLGSILARTEAELAAEVRTTLEPGIAELDAALRGLPADGGSAAATQALATFIDGELRPLSRRLVADAAIPADAEVTDLPRRQARVPIPARLAVADALDPAVVTTFVVAIGTPYGLRLVGIPTAIPYIAVGALIAFLTLAGARRVLARTVLPTPLTVIVAIAVSAGAGALTQLTLTVLFPSGRPTLATPLTFLLVGAVYAAGAVVAARRGATEAELRETIDGIATSLAVIRRETWRARRRLSTLVHGAIQGALHAAALRIARAGTVDADLAASVRTEIAAALATIDAPAEVPPSLDAAVAVLTDLWDGSCGILARIAADADACLARDPGARAAAFEVIREANLNAIRHGGARNVTIDVALHGARAITVRVADDGRGWTGERGRGRGSGILDELTTGWTHVQDGRGTTLTATIPLG